MRRSRLTALLAGVALSASVWSVALAAPHGQPTVEMACSDGNTYDMNLGAPPNNSSTAWVAGTNVVLVGKTLEIRVDGEVVFSWDRGSEGFEDADLISCSGDLGGAILSVTAFLTPRS